MKRIKNLPLVKRLILLYLIGPLFIFILFSFLIVWFSNRQATYELQISIDSDLKRTIDNIDETIDTLSMIVEQMSFGYLGTNLRSMLTETNPYKKSQLIKELSNEINIISFTNTKIKLMGYYDKLDEHFVFVANGSSSDIPVTQQKQLIQQKAFSFYGPHITQARNYNDLVVSVTKDVPSVDNTMAYAELSLDLDLTDPFLQNSKIVITNLNGQILYNNGIINAENLTTAITSAQINPLQTISGNHMTYFYTRMQSKEGYYVYLFTPQKEFLQYFKLVLPNVLLSILCLGVIFTIIVIMLARNIFSPLRIFEKEILKIQQGDLSSNIYHPTGIPEYDKLLDEVFIMKGKIRQLIDDVSMAQKEQTKLKTDQLLYKINPHFLMNSLDTIHWLAVKKNTQEIDNVARSLNKLLYYNLKVDQNLVFVSDELDAVQQYIQLQRSRFDFCFKLNVSNPEALKQQVPKFILQPLIENAIYHGIHEDGEIILTVSMEEQLIFSVRDNGNGVDASTLEELLKGIHNSQENNKLGIGLNYVMQILHEHYGKMASITIDSLPEDGTEIKIQIPLFFCYNRRY